MLSSLNFKRHFLIIFSISTAWAVLSSFVIGLSDQEAYYWTWSRSLEWSYFEHPPLQAWMSRILSEIFGDSSGIFGLPASLIGRSIGFYYLFQWAKTNYTEKTVYLGLSFLCSSFFILAGSLILPDAYLFPCFAHFFIFRASISFRHRPSFGFGNPGKMSRRFVCARRGLLISFSASQKTKF